MNLIFNYNINMKILNKEEKAFLLNHNPFAVNFVSAKEQLAICEALHLSDSDLDEVHEAVVAFFYPKEIIGAIKEENMQSVDWARLYSTRAAVLCVIEDMMFKKSRNMNKAVV